MGRRSTFTQELADEICERVSNGEPLAQVCRDERMPQLRTVYDWMEANEAFAAHFARARVAGYDMIAQDALRIADTPVLGEIVRDSGKDGRVVTQEDMLGHRKLQVETRLKLLAKWDPKRYGDKLELSGNKDAPLTVQVVRLGDEK